MKRRMVYANARPEPAILVRQYSVRVFHLEDSGTMRIEPGDVLVAFTGAITEEAVLRVIRENPGERAGRLVSGILDSGRGTVIAVRFIATEEPALAEDSAELDLAVA